VIEPILYLLFVLCIAGVFWFVFAITAGIRRSRKSRLIEQGLTEYLRERGKPKQQIKAN
jgi:hypothetical protein